MRIFHLADLHIGKKLNNISFLDDQREILAQVRAEIFARRPDALILAGDLYDRRLPPVEAVNLLDAFLSDVVLTLGVPVLAIAGNHDSGERLNFAGGILAKAGLHMAGRLALPLTTVTLHDQWGAVYFHLLPYADLATIRHALANDALGDYNSAMQAVLATLQADFDHTARHVLVAHGVVIGQETPLFSDSERDLSIGGAEEWSSALLNDFDYVALGHLHRPQRSGGEHIRYAGSLLKYSFSEENQRKALLQIDLGPKGQREITEIPLIACRDVRTIEGELAVLLQDSSNDYIRAILTDKGELLEPMAQLKTVYPNILELRRTTDLTAPSEPLAAPGQAKRSPEDLFGQFYRQLTGEDMSAAESDVLKDIFQEIDKEVG